MQQNLFLFPRSQTAYGGSLLKGKRKTARPISIKQSMRVIMRATMAKGEHSLLLPKNARLTFQLLTRYSKRFEVKIYNFAFVGNHLHLIVKAKTKDGLRHFLRVFAGQTAQRFTKSARGKPLGKRFWDLVAYTRILVWGRAFKHAQNYVLKNILQGAIIRKVSFLENTG